MEKENLEKELELINLKLDLASLETTKYIHDFEKIKEIIGGDENSEENINEKESRSDNNGEDEKQPHLGDIINEENNDTMEVDDFKTVYKRISNFENIEQDTEILNKKVNELDKHVKLNQERVITPDSDFKTVIHTELESLNKDN
tara:strand:+ start:436 stop:870 length:435 start_codon:yes stop_codon:yes gene_type:complete